MNKKDFKRYFQFILVILAAGSIYPLIYLKTNYQETILSVYGISLADLNQIFAILGVVFIIGYFPSGWLADKFSTRNLLSFSLIVTGGAGLWFAQVPSFFNVKIIFAIWGISSVFTFWSSHMKAVKLLAHKEEEGRFFGILDGGRGVVEAVLASIALIIFSSTLGANTTDPVSQKIALIRVIYMYSSVLIILSIFIFLFLKLDESKKESVDLPIIESASFIESIKYIAKNRLVWLLGGIIFMCYIVTWTVYYFGGFLQTNIGADAVKVGSVTLVALWMRPIGGISAGFLGDKFGKINILQIVAFLAACTLILMAVLPESMSIGLFYLCVVFTSLMIYSIRGLYWSLIGDCRINDRMIGMTIGFVSLIAYLPDVIIPIVNTHLFNVYGDKGGYNAYFIFSGIAGFTAVALLLIFKKLARAPEKEV